MAYVRKYYGYDEASRQEDKSTNELMQELQQQILLYKESTNKKLQKIEELIELAAERMNILIQLQVEKRGKGCVSPFGWKANVRHDRTMQQSGVTPDALHHFESRLSKFRETEVFKYSENSEHQKFIGEEPIYNADLETCTGKPIYDVDQGEGQECWPEQDFILAALNGGNLEFPNSFQSEICKSERSEELEEKYVGTLVVDPYIFRSIGSSTTNCMTAPRNSLTLSTEDMDVHSVGNNSNGKLELNGLSPLLDETGIYHDLEKPPEPSMPTKKAVHHWKLVLMAENAKFLEFGYLSSPLSCPAELEWTGSDNIHASHTCDMKLWFLMTANSHRLGSLAIYWENTVFIFDPGSSYVQNTNSKGVIKMLTEKARHEVIPDDAIITSVCGQTRHCLYTSLNFLAIEQLWRKPFQLQRKVLKVFIIQIGNLDRLQIQIQTIQKVSDGIDDEIFSKINQQNVAFVRVGMIVPPCRRQGSPCKIGRLEVKEAWRRKYRITIFDPGGVFRILNLLVTRYQQLLQDILNGKQLSCAGKRNTAEMYFILVDRS